MVSRLDQLLIESLRPHNMNGSEYGESLKRPAGVLEKLSNAGASQELVRIVRSWPEMDSPLSRCRVLSVLRQLKYSLPLPHGSMGEFMLAVVERSIPSGVMYIARLHEIGFSCFLFAHDLYEQTLTAFRKEKGVELDLENRKLVFETYLLAVYHMGRSRMMAAPHREVILAGVHDSYNHFFLRAHGLPTIEPQSFVKSYELVVENWIKSASDPARVQSPAYALVRTVFNLVGLMSPVERMACATLLEASANHMLELGEVLQQNRVSAGM